MITLDTNGSIVIYKIIENFHEYPLKNQKILLFNEIVCIAYKKKLWLDHRLLKLVMNFYHSYK